MKLRSLGFAFAALLVASLAAPAWAAEKKVKMADLPPAVQQAVKEQSRGATLRGLSTETENGKTTYEAQLTVNGHSRDVEFDADGKVLEVEDTVAMGSLSADVKAGVEKAAGSSKIKSVASITRDGKIVGYEAVVVSAAGKRSEVQVDPEGKPAHLD
jgi:uncharacterized membrane protein YkoI